MTALPVPERWGPNGPLHPIWERVAYNSDVLHPDAVLAKSVPEHLTPCIDGVAGCIHGVAGHIAGGFGRIGGRPDLVPDQVSDARSCPAGLPTQVGIESHTPESLERADALS